MKRSYVGSVAALLALILTAGIAEAQVHWNVGGRLGLSIVTASYGGVSGTSAGLQVGPAAEVIFGKQIAIGTEFDINTQSGTPIEWGTMFKYYFLIPGSKILPYADAGVGLLFLTGGPYFGIRFGGGALFPIAHNLYIPADVQLGPVFVTGTTAFFIEITSGVRYFI
jgi:hypothetical protein